MTDSTSPQTPLSAYDVEIRHQAEQARKISTDPVTFLSESRKWCKDMDGWAVTKLIDLGIEMDAAADPDANVAARLKSLREAVTSLVHHNNSSSLGDVITNLNKATKKLDNTILVLTALGIFLALVQVLISVIDHVFKDQFLQFLLILGLGIVLILPLLPVLMRHVDWAAAKLRSAAEPANAGSGRADSSQAVGTPG